MEKKKLYTVICERYQKGRVDSPYWQEKTIKIAASSFEEALGEVIVP